MHRGDVLVAEATVIATLGRRNLVESATAPQPSARFRQHRKRPQNGYALCLSPRATAAPSLAQHACIGLRAVRHWS
jgi:hypothetical protein